MRCARGSGGCFFVRCEDFKRTFATFSLGRKNFKCRFATFSFGRENSERTFAAFLFGLKNFKRTLAVFSFGTKTPNAHWLLFRLGQKLQTHIPQEGVFLIPGVAPFGFTPGCTLARFQRALALHFISMHAEQSQFQSLCRGDCDAIRFVLMPFFHSYAGRTEFTLG